MRIRTGTDIIEISRVKESIESTNKKFCERVYTEKEYEKFRVIQDQKYISSMDEFYNEYLNENSDNE